MRRVPIESRYKDIFANHTEQARADACMVYMYHVYACLIPRLCSFPFSEVVGNYHTHYHHHHSDITNNDY